MRVTVMLEMEVGDHPYPDVAGYFEYQVDDASDVPHDPAGAVAFAVRDAIEGDLLPHKELDHWEVLRCTGIAAG